MKNMRNKPTKISTVIFLIIIGLVISLLTSCSELNNPGGYNSGYRSGDGYYGDPYYDDYRRDDYRRRRDLDRERDRARDARRELDRERERVEEERRRLEQERNANQYRRPTQPREDRCPAGFSPSEQKCTQEERRRGCKDMRLPSGLGCVHR